MTYEVTYPLAYISFCEFTQGAYVQMSNSLLFNMVTLRPQISHSAFSVPAFEGCARVSSCFSRSTSEPHKNSSASRLTAQICLFGLTPAAEQYS